MIGLRIRMPKPSHIFTAICALKTLPSQHWSAYFRESQAKTPNLRCEGSTNGLDWVVDVYSSHYLRIKIGTELSEVCKSVPAMLSYLKTHLGVKDEPTPNDIEEC